jgi:hypothetical protein
MREKDEEKHRPTDRPTDRHNRGGLLIFMFLKVGHWRTDRGGGGGRKGGGSHDTLPTAENNPTSGRSISWSWGGTGGGPKRGHGRQQQQFPFWKQQRTDRGGGVNKPKLKTEIIFVFQRSPDRRGAERGNSRLQICGGAVKVYKPNKKKLSIYINRQTAPVLLVCPPPLAPPRQQKQDLAGGRADRPTGYQSLAARGRSEKQTEIGKYLKKNYFCFANKVFGMPRLS